MKIAFDLDEVLNDFMRGFILFFENKTGKKIRFEDVKSYNFWESGIGKDREDAISMVNEFHDSEYYENINVALYAKEVVKKLIDGGHEIFIVTSRPEHIKEITKDFIKNNFSDKIDIIYSNDFFKTGGKSKAEIAKDLGINFIIEDNLNYARECAKNGICVFLVNKPWNEQAIGKGDGKIIRINQLNEILEHINGN